MVANSIASRRSRAAFDEEVLLLSTWIDSTYCRQKDADDVSKTGGTYDGQTLEYENSLIP